MSKSKAQQAEEASERADAIARLRAAIERPTTSVDAVTDEHGEERSAIVTSTDGPRIKISAEVCYVSRSGMLRKVRVYVPSFRAPDSREPAGCWSVWDASYLVARAIGYRFDRDVGAIVVPGCGFNAGHAVVYALGTALYGREASAGKSPGLEWAGRQSY